MVIVTASFKVLIGCPEESVALIVTAFLLKIEPVGGFGRDVFVWVLIVLALDEVPSAFAGIFILKFAPISLLVKNPPEVGVTVSCFSGLTVNPVMAVRVNVFPVEFDPLTVTVTGELLYPILPALTVQVPLLTGKL